MPVNIIDTLKPKNGGSFPIVEAIDVFVEGYSSLADAVSHFATDVMISAIETVLNGKANTSDVTNLQNQINQIEISATAESIVAPEVAAARVGADGKSYATLKERIDSETSALASEAKTIEASLYSIGGKKQKTYSVSDKDGSYFFMEYSLKQGKKYIIENTGAIATGGIFLRAEKYTTPSLQTVTNSLAAGSSIEFTADYDISWIVIACPIQNDQTFSVAVSNSDAAIKTMQKELESVSSISEQLSDSINQFVDLDTSLNDEDFELGYHLIYGDTLYESTTRITLKNPETKFEFDTVLTASNDAKIYIVKETDAGASSWQDGPVTIPSGVGCSITLKYNDDREIASISDLVSLYSITNDFTAKVALLNNAAAQTPIMQEDISDAKDDIIEINRKLNDFVEIEPSHFNADDFILGGRSIYGGTPNSSTTRATYTPAVYHTSGRMRIVPSSSAKIYVYRENGTKIEWTSEPIILEANSNFSIVVAYTDDREITSISDLVALFDILYEFDIVVAEIKEAVSKVDQMTLDEYAGKKISILGDSISTFGGSASDDPSERISDGTYTYEGNRCRYPQSNLLLDVNDTYWMRMINKFGMVLGINESWAGSLVSWDGTTESQDIGADKHIASATRIGHLDENGTPDIILVNAGTNDIGASVTVGTFNYDNPMNYTEEEIAALPVATFADAYRTMLIRLQKWFPTSRIVVLLPNFTSTYYTPQKADEYCEIIKEACDYFGVKWIDMRSSGITMFNRATYLPDGIHYNAAGMSIVAKNVEKFMTFSFTV